jgi:hypothetical protein
MLPTHWCVRIVFSFHTARASLVLTSIPHYREIVEITSRSITVILQLFPRPTSACIVPGSRWGYIHFLMFSLIHLCQWRNRENFLLPRKSMSFCCCNVAIICFACKCSSGYLLPCLVHNQVIVAFLCGVTMNKVRVSILKTDRGQIVPRPNSTAELYDRKYHHFLQHQIRIGIILSCLIHRLCHIRQGVLSAISIWLALHSLLYDHQSTTRSSVFCQISRIFVRLRSRPSLHNVFPPEFSTAWVARYTGTRLRFKGQLNPSFAVLRMIKV